MTSATTTTETASAPPARARGALVTKRGLAADEQRPKQEEDIVRGGLKFVAVSVLEAVENTFSLWADVQRALRGDKKAHGGQDCCPKRGCCEALLWTNFLLVIPASMYFYNGFVAASAAVVLSSTLSFLYHLYSEAVHWHLVADKVGALGAFATTVPHMAPRLSLAGTVVAVFLVCLAFWFKHHQDRNYDVYHSLWHASIFVGQVFLTMHLDFTIVDLVAHVL